MRNRPPNYRVECRCGWNHSFYSKVVADALAASHGDGTALHDTEVVEL